MHHCAENLITLPHGHLEWKTSDHFPLGLSVPVAEQHLSERRAPGIREADAELISLPRRAPVLWGHRPVLAPLHPQESPGPGQGGWRRVPKPPAHPESPRPRAQTSLRCSHTFVSSHHSSHQEGQQRRTSTSTALWFPCCPQAQVRPCGPPGCRGGCRGWGRAAPHGRGAQNPPGPAEPTHTWLWAPAVRFPPGPRVPDPRGFTKFPPLRVELLLRLHSQPAPREQQG